MCRGGGVFVICVVWRCGCVDVWMCGCVDVCMCACVDVCMCACVGVGVWVSEELWSLSCIV